MEMSIKNANGALDLLLPSSSGMRLFSTLLGLLQSRHTIEGNFVVLSTAASAVYSQGVEKERERDREQRKGQSQQMELG